MSVIVFSDSNPAVKPRSLVRKECRTGLQRLGVNDYRIYRFTMRELSAFRKNILQIMFDAAESFNPDMVFIPSPSDLHNDHFTVAREGMRAFKRVTTFAYEMPWNNITFNTQAFIGLQHHHIRKKLYAMQAYKSQMGKTYFSEDFIMSLARTRGVQAGCELAETFEVIRWVG